MNMEATAKRSITSQLYHFFTQRVVYHSLAWFFFVVLLSIFDSILNQDQSIGFIIFDQIILMFFYALGVYFNILYLIPNYLSQKKYAVYLILLFLTVFIVTPLQIVSRMLIFQAPDYEAYLIGNRPWIFLFTFLFIVGSTILKIISDWLRHQRERKELETQTMQSELRFLKSQINPHFLFNTLNNLYALTLKKSDKAPEIVIKLSEMMRYMLYECNEKWVPLYKEVNYLKNYLELERLRQGKEVEINFDIAGNVSNQEIAPLLFIPFIENCFKHGLSNTLDKGFVNISLNIEANSIFIFIENSKPSVPARFHKRSGGIGLVNVRRRLDLLYLNKYELTIEDSPKNYSVSLELEL
jgi:two-component system, LytTR family, sensor kinase